MYRELYDWEKVWLEKYLQAKFKGKEILRKQIEKAKVEGHQERTCVYLEFHVTEPVEKYPYPVRVPLNMFSYHKERGPIWFMLHIVNGLIYEFEVIMTDGLPIDIDNIDNIPLDPLKYEVDEEVAIGQGED